MGDEKKKEEKGKAEETAEKTGEVVGKGVKKGFGIAKGLGKGLVKGVKGPGGGYQLAREPATIRVGDIVRAVEGPFAVAQCVTATPGSRSTCHRAEGCTTRLLWVRLSEVIAEFLDTITLKELCDQAQQLNPGNAFGPYRTVETLAETAGQLPSFNSHCALLGQPSHREASLLAVSVYTYEI